MRISQFYISTLKETPADAELVSHRFMLRAGMIRKLSSGIYTWMPLGLRTLHKITAIVREEMNRAGAVELLMPNVQPQELWAETGRWEDYGSELLKIKDRNEREFCYGPTHEEVITDLARNELRSYKQLPVNFYQIGTKFRDEIRPRFGVMRAREFIMKDAYSFDIDEAGLKKSYQTMYDAYVRIFDRLGLNYRPVLADTGSIGGNYSHEFQVLADSGEDTIVYSNVSSYAANIEQAEALPERTSALPASASLEKVATPNTRTIAEVCEFLKVTADKTLKILLVQGREHAVVGILLRGDHELNAIKAEKHPLIAHPLTFVSDATVEATLSCKPGYIGPLNLNIPLIADRSAAVLSDFVCGANEEGFHYQHVNWGRDLPIPEIADLRNVVPGDPSPDGQGTLEMRRGIEVGHVFQLYTKYSESLGAKVLDENGKSQTLFMGCYGIGVSRIAAAAIEQNHDAFGIIWPEAIAPFEVVIMPIKLKNSERVRAACEALYLELKQAGVDVLYYDRDERPGVMFAELDLIGIPHRIVVGDKGLDEGTVEYKSRRSSEVEVAAKDHIVSKLLKSLAKPT